MKKNVNICEVFCTSGPGPNENSPESIPGTQAKRLHFSLGRGGFDQAALSLSDAAEPSTNVHLQLSEG